MRSAQINGNIPKEDVLGVLTGVWNEYDERDWHVVKTPFMVAMTATLKAGPQILPVAPPRTTLLSWANAEHSGSLVLKAKDKNFSIPENAVVQVVMFGTMGDTKK